MEGIRPDKIFKTGSHMYEVIENNKRRIEQSKIIEELKLKKDNYFLVSIHREENIDDTENFKSLMKVLDNLWLKYKLKIIVTTHPRTRKKNRKRKNKYFK